MNFSQGCKKHNPVNAERIPRGFMVKTFLPWMPLRRFKCYSCMKKFYILGEVAEKQPSQVN